MRYNPDLEDDVLDEDEIDTDVRDAILDASEKALDDLANASAAMTWSTPSDKDPEDIIIVAHFGDWWAKNGNLVWSKGNIGNGPGGREDIEIPKNYISNEFGGKIPITEEEISIESISDWIKLRKDDFDLDGITNSEIDTVIAEKYGDHDVTYTSVSGESTHYEQK